MAETFRLWSYNKLPRCLLWFVWFRKYLVFPCDLWKSLCGIWLLLLSGDNGKGGVALEYENHKDGRWPCLPGLAWPKKSGALSRVIYESLASMIHGWSLKVWTFHISFCWGSSRKRPSLLDRSRRLCRHLEKKHKEVGKINRDQRCILSYVICM